MSGSGDTDFSTGGGGNSQQDCRTLSGQGTIMSPAPTVLATLNVNDYLDVKVRTVTALQGVTLGGLVVGGVFVNPGSLQSAIIACINDGNEYQGRITSLVGGLCELFISVK
jgi:flagellar biosynthesis/type III secretory pathway ATPase